MSNPKNRGIGHHRVDRLLGDRLGYPQGMLAEFPKPPKKMVLKTAKRFHNCKEKKWFIRKSKS